MILVDTNIVARTLQPSHRHHKAAVDSMALLAANEDEEFVICVHSLYELYFLMTKPLASNGFGYSATQASTKLDVVEGLFPLIPESATAYGTWRTLIAKYGITNRPCFDAKIVASMLECGIPRILTFNDKDFDSYTEITTLNPFDVLGIPRVT